MEKLRLVGKALKCWWCARAINEEPRHVNFRVQNQEYQVDVCSEKCAEQVTWAYAYFKKFVWLFWVGMGGFITLMIVGRGGMLSIYGLMLGGATLFICPFVTPQTIQLIGLRKSFLIGRVAGVLLFVGSIILLVSLKLI